LKIEKENFNIGMIDSLHFVETPSPINDVPNNDNTSFNNILIQDRFQKNNSSGNKEVIAELPKPSSDPDVSETKSHDFLGAVAAV
jgi:hypothetical protein